jgi:hypothetical protein
VTASSIGGASSSGSSAVALSPGTSFGIVSDSVIASPLSGWIRSVTLMSNSSFSPWLVKPTVNIWPGANVS